MEMLMMADDTQTIMGDEDIALLMMDRNEEGLKAMLRQYGGKVQIGLENKFAGLLHLTDINCAISMAATKLFLTADKYDKNKGTYGALLYRYACNCAKDIFSKDQKHYHDPLDFRAECASGLQATPTPAMSPGMDATCDQLRAVINDLPHHQKHIIESDLASHDVASAERLAKELGTSKGSVYVVRNKARKTIEEKMAKHIKILDRKAEMR